eukprot:16364-Heterococcus_DN1.PRE.2
MQLNLQLVYSHFALSYSTKHLRWCSVPFAPCGRVDNHCKRSTACVSQPSVCIHQNSASAVRSVQASVTASDVFLDHTSYMRYLLLQGAAIAEGV